MEKYHLQVFGLPKVRFCLHYSSRLIQTRTHFTLRNPTFGTLVWYRLRPYLRTSMSSLVHQSIILGSRVDGVPLLVITRAPSHIFMPCRLLRSFSLRYHVARSLAISPPVPYYLQFRIQLPNAKPALGYHKIARLPTPRACHASQSSR